MIKNDVYGKPLSTFFSSAISGFSQVVKPKITINLLDSRHLSNVVITNTDVHTVNTKGSIGYYFTNNQLVNGYEQESFPWAVCDAKEKDGSAIKADGRFHAAPAVLTDDYEFGLWSKTKSQANGVFASSPTITITFDERKVNKVRVVTSESLGQIKEFRIRVQSSTFIDLLDKTVTLTEDEYYKDFYLKSTNASNASYNAAKIILTVISTKNGNDVARIHEVAPIYELDITDQVIDYSVSRSRDTHESNLPIGGTQSPKVTIKIDNTSKDWNSFNQTTGYGKYMKKDLEVNVATGWRIKKTNDIISQTLLANSLSNSATSMTVLDAAIFPSGGPAGSFYITIDPDNESREIILCNAVTGADTVSFLERGYYDSEPIAHADNAVVQFDPYEYVNMGTYYVDEWSSSTSDMTVTIQASDFSKFLSEKNLTNGFLVENSTVGNGVLNLLMQANFPKSKFKQTAAYSKDGINYGAVASYSFSENSIDKTGSIASLEPGLRARFFGMRSDKLQEYKNIKVDVLEKNLSIEEKIAGVKSFVTPDNTVLTTENPGSAVHALSYSNYTFTSVLTSETFTKYFNGVVDGYYIPLTSGDQDLMLRIANGGGRMYLDDVLIIDTKREATSSADFSAYTFRGNSFLNLEAGVPYRLRIEFFHGAGEANFSIGLYKGTSSLVYTLMPDSEVRPVVARDGLGGRNSNEALGSYSIGNVALSHHQNDGFLSSNVQLAYAQSVTTEQNNRGILLIDNGYVRIPNHSSIAMSEKDFSIELIAKFHDGHFTTGSGEYLSTWANSSPLNGYEFYFNGSSSHGIKIKTSSGVYSATGTSEFLPGDFYHIVATYNTDDKKLKYYVNGVTEGQVTLAGNIVTQTGDVTVGGRGASFTAGTGESGIAVGRDFIFDEFAIYKKTLSDTEVLNRYISAQVDTPQTFPFLYSGIGHIREAMDAITLGDLGRFYIDEEGYARYESYNRFFEASIDQHANVQYTISDSSDIISSDYTNQLQTNKVVVKISSVANIDSGTQPLWTAPSPTTLAVVKLTSGIEVDDTLIPVSTTTDPVFSKTGYLALSKTVSGEVKTEIIKYKSKTDTSFLEVERAQFDTTALAFDADTKVREARYFQINFDKAPAIGVNQPFIIGINDENPDMINVLKFEYSGYSAKLIIAASADNDYGAIVYAQGKDPISEKEYFASVSGIPVTVISNTEQVSEQTQLLQENIRKYGLKELTIDSPYITSLEHAEKIAKFIIEKMSEPVPIVNINIMAIPTIQLGDRIKIGSLDAFDIIDGEYWVTSQEFSYGESISHSLILRKVV
jgi:hypothetical protein